MEGTRKQVIVLFWILISIFVTLYYLTSFNTMTPVLITCTDEYGVPRNSLTNCCAEGASQEQSITNCPETLGFAAKYKDTPKPKRFLMIQYPTGRLGNQMFDFACALGIANTFNYKLVIHPLHPMLQLFKMNHTLSKRVDNVKKLPVLRWDNETWKHDRAYLNHNLTLDSIYRIWKFFENVSDEVRTSLTVKRVFLNKAKKFLQAHIPKRKTLIGVHVRRGDFLNEREKDKGRVVASKKYLSKAIGYFRKRYKSAIFVVVSNDMVWCKENIDGDDVIFSDFAEAIVDMAILTLCDHTVITTGTFSWWGGWLAGGTVVYCSDYPKPGSYLDKNTMFHEDFYPPSWIGMTNY